MTSTLIELDASGHTELTWEQGTASERDARLTFETLRDAGYRGDVKRDGEWETIHEFDPTADAIVMSRQTVGG